jgi:hypothetical protein
MKVFVKEILIIIGLAVALALSLFYVASKKVEENPHDLHFIWNADDEGVPPVGGEVIIEMIEGDTIYLIPKED